jgi:fructosamine-3-kinase
MNAPRAFSPADAEQHLSDWLGASVTCTHLQPMSGGMVNRVLLAEFDRDPGRAVLKVSPEAAMFDEEFGALSHIHTHTEFPVPEPYFHLPFDPARGYTLLALEYLPGIGLDRAPISGQDRTRIEQELAEALLGLHDHHAQGYGPAADATHTDWARYFADRVRGRAQKITDKVPAATVEQIGRVLDRFDTIFAEAGPPTLVHGDVWITNILVTKEEDGWHLLGLVDPKGLYADVEFELSYIEVFNTLGEAFFDAYAAQRPARQGYALRRAVYWLDVMIRHVDRFGDDYYRVVAASLAAQLDAATA